MKSLLVVLFFALGWVGARAQDAPFTFQSPFASDGTNNRGLDSQSRNALIFEEIWDTYIRARKELEKPMIKVPAGQNQELFDHAQNAFRYGELLEAMVELRAFTTQNRGYANGTQEKELARIDEVLRALNLHYYEGSGQAMVDLCDKIRPRQIRRNLAPILLKDDGTPRPIPPFQLGSNR